MAIVISGPKKAKGGDPKPKSSYKKGAKYKLLMDQYTHVGAGSDYFYSEYGKLPAAGKKLAVREDDYALLTSGTTVVCLEAKRNWIRTSAGWIQGSFEGSSYVKRA